VYRELCFVSLSQKKKQKKNPPWSFVGAGSIHACMHLRGNYRTGEGKESGGGAVDNRDGTEIIADAVVITHPPISMRTWYINPNRDHHHASTIRSK